MQRQPTFLTHHLPRVLLTAVLLAPWVLYSLKHPKGAIAAPRANIDLRITTFNTEYWHSSERELLEQVRYRDMDVVMLQEHLELRGEDYFPTDRIPQLTAALDAGFIDHHGEVVTVSKWPIVASKQFSNGEAVRSDLRLADGRIVSVYNVHLPVHLHFKLLSRPWALLQDAAVVAQRREQLLREVTTDIAANSYPIIVGGDFNSSLAMNGARWFREHLIDTYSARHCDGRRATWSLAGVLSWRIDYVFVSKHFAPSSYCIEPQPAISDHSAVVTTLVYDAPVRLGAMP
jgi:endonuclease/exonuclease/phosphatase (EEP) superfamily protein YafD